MAWNHNARNRSAEVRRVNYHEDGPSRSSGSSGGNNRFDGDLSPVAKLIIGGIAIYTIGYLGLGGLWDTVTNAWDVLKSVGDKPSSSYSESQQTTSSNSSNSSNKTYSRNIENKLDIEAEDIADILEVIDEQLIGIGSNPSTGEVVILDYEVFTSDKDYKKHVIDKLDKYKGQVTFIGVYDDEFILEQEQLDRIFEVASDVIKNNRELGNNRYTSIKFGTVVNEPAYGNASVFVTFY